VCGSRTGGRTHGIARFPGQPPIRRVSWALQQPKPGGHLFDGTSCTSLRDGAVAGRTERDPQACRPRAARSVVLRKRRRSRCASTRRQLTCSDDGRCSYAPEHVHPERLLRRRRVPDSRARAGSVGDATVRKPARGSAAAGDSTKKTVAGFVVLRARRLHDGSFRFTRRRASSTACLRARRPTSFAAEGHRGAPNSRQRSTRRRTTTARRPPGNRRVGHADGMAPDRREDAQGVDELFRR